MTACFDPTHFVTPERANKLQGPEVGALCRYTHEGRWYDTVVRVLARSYVWAPEQHNVDGTHGYRHYDWSVIETKPGQSMVVNDTDLDPIIPGDPIHTRTAR